MLLPGGGAGSGGVAGAMGCGGADVGCTRGRSDSRRASSQTRDMSTNTRVSSLRVPMLQQAQESGSNVRNAPRQVAQMQAVEMSNVASGNDVVKV